MYMYIICIQCAYIYTIPHTHSSSLTVTRQGVYIVFYFFFFISFPVVNNASLIHILRYQTLSLTVGICGPENERRYVYNPIICPGFKCSGNKFRCTTSAPESECSKLISTPPPPPCIRSPATSSFSYTFSFSTACAPHAPLAMPSITSSRLF